MKFSAGGIAISAVLLAGAATAAWYTLREEPLEPIEVVAARARRARIVRRVQGVGHIEPVTKVRVSASISGDLLALHVKEGDQVKQGALLAEIDRERLLALVRQQEASARSAAAQVQLEQARLDQAQVEAKRSEDLRARNVTSQAEVDRLKADVGVIQASIEGARQRVEQAKASLDEARARLEETRIIAPMAGTVISLEKKVGERIRGSDLAEDPLLTLAPLHAMEVEVEVGEGDVVKVEIGQVAEAEVDALEGMKVQGKVVEIASSAVVKNRGTEMEVTTFKVKVALDTIPEGLRSGMTAQVSITTDVREDALAVPLEAITARLPSELELRAEEAKKAEAKKKKKKGFSFGSPDEEEPPVRVKREKPARIVFQVSSGRAEPRKITTGISSDAEIEVIDGLNAGDEVVVAPYRALAKDLLPGSPIKVTETIGEGARTDAQIAGGRAP